MELPAEAPTRLQPIGSVSGYIQHAGLWQEWKMATHGVGQDRLSGKGNDHRRCSGNFVTIFGKLFQHYSHNHKMHIDSYAVQWNPNYGRSWTRNRKWFRAYSRRKQHDSLSLMVSKPRPSSTQLVSSVPRLTVQLTHTNDIPFISTYIAAHR